MSSRTDRQRKALDIFQFVLNVITLVGELFKAHHAKDLSDNVSSPDSSDVAPYTASTLRYANED